MSDQQERALPLRPIPKRPPQQPGQLPSLPKRPSLVPEPSQPIPIGITEQPEQPLERSSIQLDEMVDRSRLSEMATVKSDALRLQKPPKGKITQIPYPAIVNREASRLTVPPERKSTPIPYPAMIAGRRERKRNLLAWVVAFTFLK